MNVENAKRILLHYPFKRDICNIINRKDTEAKIDSLWNDYVEFMVLKAIGCDTGQDETTRFIASPLIEDLWQSHILCTSNYETFMKLVNQINPLVDFVHHSLDTLFCSHEIKEKRIKDTSEAYRYEMVFALVIMFFHGFLCVLPWFSCNVFPCFHYVLLPWFYLCFAMFFFFFIMPLSCFAMLLLCFP